MSPSHYTYLIVYWEHLQFQLKIDMFALDSFKLSLLINSFLAYGTNLEFQFDSVSLELFTETSSKGNLKNHERKTNGFNLTDLFSVAFYS